LKQSRIFFVLLTLIISAFSLNYTIKGNDFKKEIFINPSSSIKQGQTAFIEIKSDRKLINPYFSYADGRKSKKIKLYQKDNNNYTGIIGFSAIDKPGAKKIFLKDQSGYLKDIRTITLKKEQFPIQNITISEEKNALTPAKGELAMIQAAKTALSDKAYWSVYPFETPTKGCIISIYGVKRYHNGKPIGDYHKGVDIKAPQGREINAIAGGKVLIADRLNLHGNTVAIDHGHGLTSIYLHMSKISVKRGEIVRQKQKIGEIGSTGFATGPHLHWGLYVNGIPVNPMNSWIKPVPKC